MNIQGGKNRDFFFGWGHGLGEFFFCVAPTCIPYIVLTEAKGAYFRMFLKKKMVRYNF